MIPLLPQKCPKVLENLPQKSWQEQMREAITDVDELWGLLKLPENDLKNAYKANSLFQLKVPLSFLSRIKIGDANDPLLRQILPLQAETLSAPGFTKDPVADLNNNPVPGIIHKYHGRALLISTGACAIHCRYCFRRHFPYNEQTAARSHWKTSVDYLIAHKDIHEVILSGGDPLSLSNAKLAELIYALDSIEHVKTIRIHSRLPIVLPDRIDTDFLALMKTSSKNIVMVLHANHPNEINGSVINTCQKMKKLGIHLLNQSVLLKGVNDSTQILENLSHSLFAAGIMPYYINLLDKVTGTSHFDITDAKALEIHNSLKKRLSGYLVPKLVRDIPERASKTWVQTNILV